MNKERTESGQWLVLITTLKGYWILGVVLAAYLYDESPWEALVILVVSVLWGVYGLRPIRIRGGEASAIGVLRFSGWEWWEAAEIGSLRYATTPWMLRFTARLVLVTKDGRSIRLPGTRGRMLFRRPSFDSGSRPSSWPVAFLATPAFLRRVATDLDVRVDTAGAEWFAPGW